MTRGHLIALGALAALAGARAANAQAPMITAKGDPSVRSDTIYKLAVDPKTAPDEAVHWLLDDGVVRVETDGRSSRTYRQVMQVLTEKGAEQEREREYSWMPGRQRLRINWVRVVKPDGTVISPAPTHQQESDVAAPVSTDPIYGETRVLRMSLTGVAPGTIVDASYTLDDTLPAMPGDFSDAWRITPGTPIERSRYIVDAPSGLDLHIKERNLPFKRVEHTANGRTTYIWATRNVARIAPEPFAADSTNTVIQTITIGAPITWSNLAGWYAGLARDRYAVSPALAQRVRGLVAGARTRDDSIRAVHRWVAQDIRYVGIELGRGGYQPRRPDSVVATGYGDCKDKATLFVAALKSIGITAYPVLLSSERGAAPDLPGVNQFNHEIAVVPGANGTRTFADLTAAYFPYGVLPPDEQGGFALVVHPDGVSEEITLPREDGHAEHVTERLVGTLSEDGTFTGYHETHLTGDGANAVRQLFAQPLDSATRHAFADNVAQRDFAHAHGDTLIGFDGKSFAAPVTIRVGLTAPQATQAAGPLLLLTLPFPGVGPFDAETERKLTASARRFPIDLSDITPEGVHEAELRVTLPAGWTAQLPKDVVVGPGPFGTYEAHYAQQGRDLVVTRRRIGARGILPPERMPDVIAWFKAIGKDDAKFVVLQRPATP